MLRKETESNYDTRLSRLLRLTTTYCIGNQTNTSASRVGFDYGIAEIIGQKFSIIYIYHDVE